MEKAVHLELPRIHAKMQIIVSDRAGLRKVPGRMHP